MQLHGALINGLETRVNQIESQLSDLDARGSEEHDNLANERELHRFILTGKLLVIGLSSVFMILIFFQFGLCSQLINLVKFEGCRSLIIMCIA